MYLLNHGKSGFWAEVPSPDFEKTVYYGPGKSRKTGFSAA
jgi:hypothetical protein